jgi:hypothetical protein
MKNFALKASVIAVASALAGAASAGTITLGNNADVDINVYANELNYDGSTTGTTITTADTVATTLGFGLSAGQNRYARVVLSSNAKFAAGFAANSFIDTTTLGAGTTGFGANAAANDGVTIVSGGNVGERCVVYQVTGLAVTGNAASDTVTWTYPNLNVTSNATPVTATYTLHETAVSASCATGTDAAVLATPVTGNIATFATSLTFTVAPATVTADVATLYKQEVDATGGASDTLQTQLATMTTSLVANNEADNSAVDLADLATAATVTVLGDFSGIGSTPGTVTLSSAACNTPVVVSTGTVAADKQSVVFSGGAILPLYTTPGTASFLCYNVDGVAEIPVASMTATPGFTAAAGATLGSIAAAPSGTVIHNGTTLKVPYAAGKAGQGAWVQLTNTSINNAGYTTACYNTSGASTVGAAGTVLAGRSAQIYAGALCPAGSVSAVMTFAVPNGSVIGSFVRQNTTSGDMGLDGVVGNQ